MSIEGLDGKFVTCQAFSACLLLVGGEEHEWHESYLPSRANEPSPRGAHELRNLETRDRRQKSRTHARQAGKWNK